MMLEASTRDRAAQQRSTTTEAVPFGVYSEYGTLHEVVVGRLDDLVLPAWGKEFSHYNAGLKAAASQAKDGSFSVPKTLPERLEKAAAELEGLAALYQRSGVIVHRPRPYTEPEKHYLDDLQHGHSQLYPADPVFVLGNHYLELNIRRAYRRKEVFPLRDVVLPIVRRSQDAHHAAMPAARPHAPSSGGPGPFLEGGDILIHGKDVIVGQSCLTSDAAGLDWLRRYLEPYGYKVHPMPMQGDILHGLGVLCLVREGLALAYMPALAEGLPPPIRDWEIIELSAAETQTFATVGVSLDQKRYIIDSANTRIMEELDKRDVEPIPLETRNLSFFGGDIRCSTLPLRREAT